MSGQDALMQRIRAEFTDMPGLKLTVAQARRLWTAGDVECLAALQALAAEGFLREMPSGAFIALPRPMGHALKVAPVRAARCPNCRHLNSIKVETSVAVPAATATYRCAACGRVVSLAAQSA